MRWHQTEPAEEEGKPQRWPTVFTFLSLRWWWPPCVIGMAHFLAALSMSIVWSLGMVWFSHPLVIFFLLNEIHPVRKVFSD